MSSAATVGRRDAVYADDEMLVEHPLRRYKIGSDTPGFYQPRDALLSGAYPLPQLLPLP